jgi:hypothetical protein
MNRSKWLNRGTLSGLLLGVLVGVGLQRGVTALANRPAPPIAAEPVEVAAPPEPDKLRAEQGCKTLSQAIDAYVNQPSHSDLPPNDPSAFPSRLDDLVTPPVGTSFLKYGAKDLLDPWGKSYQMQRLRHPDGTLFVLVTTTAPDGTPISQFGIGEKAKPPAK